MNYINESFGPLDRNTDTFAVVKFVLNLIFIDKDFIRLRDILDEDSGFQEIGGDPGWFIERLSPYSSDRRAIKGAEVTFKVGVDPDEFYLAVPQVIVSKAVLCDYVRVFAKAFVAHHGDDQAEIVKLDVLQL